MSTSTASSLAFATQQVIIYVGFFIFVAGLIGGPLVLIVFLSLRTFRQSSCAFYLTIMSIVNTFHLFTGLLTFIMINGFGINWTNMSLFYCKFRAFYVPLCISTSLTCMCLATIDQFLATCSHPRWHQWNKIKTARYIVAGAVIVWILHSIPYLMYNNHILSSVTGTSSCAATNNIFKTYNTIVYPSVFTTSLPLTIMIIFGILAYRNVQRIAYRAVPLVRRELDKQLTVMVLVQVLCNFITLTPKMIQGITFLIINPPTDPVTTIQTTSITNLMNTFFYFYYVIPFYIYVCASKRFRQQLIYVLFKVHLNRWLGQKVNNNRIEPQA